MNDNLFEHKSAVYPEDCKFIISPSRLASFFSDPGDWFRSEVLKEKQFLGNTASLIGTLCHAVYEAVTKNEPVDRQQLNHQLAVFLNENPEVANQADYAEIVSTYPNVVNVVVNEFVLPRNKIYSDVTVESSMYTKVHYDGIYLGGTIDRLEKSQNIINIIDYKTVNRKPSDGSIPLGYKLQLLSYAYILRTNNIQLNPGSTISIVYGIKPTKTLPARCICQTEIITDEHWQLIEDTINLVCDTMLCYWQKPYMDYLLFKDYSLR